MMNDCANFPWSRLDFSTITDAVNAVLTKTLFLILLMLVVLEAQFPADLLGTL